MRLTALPHDILELILDYYWSFEHWERFRYCLRELDFKHFKYLPFPFYSRSFKSNGWFVVNNLRRSYDFIDFADADADLLNYVRV